MKGDVWKEYRAIEEEADAAASTARRFVDETPEQAQVWATLAVSARLEALSYAIRHSETPDPRYDP